MTRSLKLCSVVNNAYLISPSGCSWLQYLVLIVVNVENPPSPMYEVGKGVKELLFPANRDRIDLVLLIGHLPKIELNIIVFVSPQLSTLQFNQLFSYAI